MPVVDCAGTTVRVEQTDLCYERLHWHCGASPSSPYDPAGRLATSKLTWRGWADLVVRIYTPSGALVKQVDQSIWGNMSEETTIESLGPGDWRVTAYAKCRWGSVSYTLKGVVTTDWITSPEPTEPPSAKAGGPYAGEEGSPITVDGSGCSDPDGTIVSYSWDFGDVCVVSI